MHANLEMEAYVCSLQFTLNYDLHMPQELQLQMMTLGHAAARQPEKQDNCGDSQFVSFLCYPLNT